MYSPTNLSTDGFHRSATLPSERPETFSPAGVLDADGDGSVADDLLGMASKFFR